MEVVSGHFRPEFINRIDEVVVFHPLGKEQIRGIADIQLSLLQKRVREREMNLSLSDDLIDKLVEVGFDPVFGARPLKRAIQTVLENPLAQEILSGHFMPGDSIQAGLDAQDRAVFSKGA